VSTIGSKVTSPDGAHAIASCARGCRCHARSTPP
jgi:hypothetical protein